MPDPIDPSKSIIFKGTDWQDVLFRTAVSHNHNVNVSGGSETATFNASAGYMKNEGTVITTYYDRLTFNRGGEVRLRPKDVYKRPGYGVPDMPVVKSTGWASNE